MNLSRNKKVLLAGLLGLVLMGGTAAAIAQVYFSNTSTYTVGTDFQLSFAAIAYDNLVPSTYTGANTCTAAAFPAYTCPSVATTIFSGDTISYVANVESDRATVTPAVTVTAGTYSAFTVSESYLAISGPTGSEAGTYTSGLPSMVSGQWYAILTTITLSQGAPTGSVSFSVQLGH
jgi:hypothetical protein